MAKHKKDEIILDELNIDGEIWVTIKRATEILNELARQIFAANAEKDIYKNYLEKNKGVEKTYTNFHTHHIARRYDVRIKATSSANLYNKKDLEGLKDKLQPTRGRTKGRKAYPPEKKEEALRLIAQIGEEGGPTSVHDVAKKLELSRQTVLEWVQYPQEVKEKALRLLAQIGKEGGPASVYHVSNMMDIPHTLLTGWQRQQTRENYAEQREEKKESTRQHEEKSVFKGATLHEYRKGLGWSAAELGRQAGINAQTIRGIERGTPPSSHTAHAILAALNRGYGKEIKMEDIEGLT